MTVQALLHTLSRRGIELRPDGDGVIVRPASRLTDSDRETIRQHKAELLAMLAGACEHVVGDPELADWYAENRHLTCARCFLDGAPLRSWLQ